MSTELWAVVLLASLVGAVILGRFAHRLLPEAHLSLESKDGVKLAMGLVVTMTALLLGLLVNSAKRSHDATKADVVHIAAGVAFLDRVLDGYGPESAPLRRQLRGAVDEVVAQMWPAGGERADLAIDRAAGTALFTALHQLEPGNEAQRSLLAEASRTALRVGQLRTELLVRTAPSVAGTLLVALAVWLVVIFFSFSLIAPANATTAFAAVVSACSVTAAILLLIELDRPFDGLLRLSSAPLVTALSPMP